ncbi:GNAT family N-acetyltransferase [Streptomyces daliensis]|uniref:GNAT family N-acetyltransferase n=1 Tax=Streptomyces daliensis TaxID=299421 RepID=A0A8T4IXL5_9ACTN|nr:GNAT family N-acetyltransferase [Streptomyces daliensis]
MTQPSSAPPCRSAEPSLTVVPYSHPEARRLTWELHAEQASVYGFADAPDDTPARDFELPRGLFVIARTHGASEAVGCGGWRLLTPQTAEIKRMYVAASARGQGLGRQILSFLEDEAAAHGVTQLVLETGARNHSALTLYRNSGYLPRTPYVSGRDTSVNRAMTKTLFHTGLNRR